MSERKRITVNDTDVQVRVQEHGTGTVYEGPWGSILGKLDLGRGGPLSVSILVDEAEVDNQVSRLRAQVAQRDQRIADITSQRDLAQHMLASTHRMLQTINTVSATGARLR